MITSKLPDAVAESSTVRRSLAVVRAVTRQDPSHRHVLVSARASR
ncbi:hypothetical protein V1634_28195 [Plantactinospora veratri]|uniref:Uncharacterized protein n=1 Tax=Plantactinospora veratri TaxID=1436122 RepID=A0ABU7SLB3_9ACTN